MRIHQYDLVLMQADKLRPVVVVSPDTMNNTLKTVVVCPLTTQLHPSWAHRCQVTSAPEPSEICADQIACIRKSSLQRVVGRLKDTEAARLRAILARIYCEDYRLRA